MSKEEKFDKRLKEAVKEYYKFQDGKNPKLVKWVHDQRGTKMLLVRFDDLDGNQMSGLMICDDWEDGHWDVTEMKYCFRSGEDWMIRLYEEGEE